MAPHSVVVIGASGDPARIGGRSMADIPALARMLSCLPVFAHQAGPALAGTDLNPVFAMPAGEGACAADAVIDIAEDAP